MIHTDMLLIIRTTKFISLGQLKTFRIYEHHTTNSTKHDVLDDTNNTSDLLPKYKQRSHQFVYQQTKAAHE